MLANYFPVLLFLAIYNGVHLAARAWLFFAGYRRGEKIVEAVSRAHVPQSTGLLKGCAAVLAGGVAQAGEDLFGPVRAEVRRRAFKPNVDACRIVPGSLDGAAGVVGAVATFLAEYPAEA